MNDERIPLLELQLNLYNNNKLLNLYNYSRPYPLLQPKPYRHNNNSPSSHSHLGLVLQNLYNNSLQLKHFHPGHKLRSQYNSKTYNLLFQRGTHNLPKGLKVILLLLLDHNSNDLQALLHYQKTFERIGKVKIAD